MKVSRNRIFAVTSSRLLAPVVVADSVAGAAWDGFADVGAAGLTDSTGLAGAAGLEGGGMRSLSADA